MKETKFFKSRRTQWRQVLKDQEASGLKVAEFCRERGIPTTTFYRWSRELGHPRRERKAEQLFSAVDVVAAKASPPEPLRVIFQSGVALHFTDCPEPEWLTELMRLVS